ncbi:tryptophan-rich sensory protein [Streptomyces sp. SL203]|nr:TspO/MBR family protein [Streptomyces sp. SL203]MCY1649670.1 tryptophan-rich sensory protein [Streptomyces sp. SL203]
MGRRPRAQPCPGLRAFPLGGRRGSEPGVEPAWNQLFFRRRSPQAGLAGTLLLDVSNVHLIRRMAATDRAAAAALTPYAAWCIFATALNVSLVRRNPRRRDHL